MTSTPADIVLADADKLLSQQDATQRAEFPRPAKPDLVGPIIDVDGSARGP